MVENSINIQIGSKAGIDVSNYESLSIICMTKDRPKEFERVIANWRQYPVEFIVSDGSETTLTEQNLKTEADRIKCHPKFVLKYRRELNFPSRFEWISKELSREFVAFNNDDDFLYAPNVNKSIDMLKGDVGIAGIYSWRNFSREYVSRRVKVSVSDALREEFLNLRIEGSLDADRNLPDAVWLSILRSENVKKALHDGFLAAKVAFVNDRLSMNVLSIAFVMSNLMSGKFVETDYCLFFKRSFDVDGDWTLKNPSIKGYDLELRTEVLRESTYNALKSTFVSEQGIEKWQEIQNCVRNTLRECRAYEFDAKKAPSFTWSRVSGKIKKELQKFVQFLIKRRISGGVISLKPSLSNQLLCRWFRWQIWAFIHRKHCCKAAYNYLKR